MKKIPTGIKSFRKLREENYYFVDKTQMIKDFLERGSEVTLVTRPRKFGKTINMSMLSESFDITKDSKEIFKGTKIMDTPYASELNQYPTIFISFADAKRDKASIVSTIKDQVLKEWDRYVYVFDDLSKYEQNKHDFLESRLMNYSNGNLEGIVDSISFLMDKLKDYYHKEVMVFIDEYDTPFIEAHTKGFYEEVRGGLSGLLHNSLKTSNSLKYAFITGIQRVAKENIFSDLNNLVVCDVTDQRYAAYFGFDSDETKELLEYYGLELNNKVKEMYDGYHIGNGDIYNPGSLLNYVDTKELTSYWVNTSANTMIKDGIKKSSRDFKEQYKELIEDGYLDTEVNLQTSFYEVESTPTLWGLFVNAGYLTVDQVIDLMDGYCRIRIPNEEVKKEFKNITDYYLSLGDGQLNRLMRYFRYEQADKFIKEYKDILYDTKLS